MKPKSDDRTFKLAVSKIWQVFLAVFILTICYLTGLMSLNNALFALIISSIFFALEFYKIFFGNDDK